MDDLLTTLILIARIARLRYLLAVERAELAMSDTPIFQCRWCSAVSTSQDMLLEHERKNHPALVWAGASQTKVPPPERQLSQPDSEHDTDLEGLLDMVRREEGRQRGYERLERAIQQLPPEKP